MIIAAEDVMDAYPEPEFDLDRFITDDNPVESDYEESEDLEDDEDDEDDEFDDEDTEDEENEVSDYGYREPFSD